MTSDKQERPDSLKYQWRLLGLVNRSDWASSLDKSIAYEIIDNYMKPHGNSRASIGYLQKATGGARSRITASLRRLTELGPFDIVRKGSGTRPSEFRPKFELVSGVVLDTSSKSGISGVALDTSSSVENDTSRAASGVESDTESVLPVDGLQHGIQVEGINDSAAPSAPPGPGAVAPAGAGTAEEGFKAVWAAYGFPYKKAEARAAYKDLNPRPALQVLIEAATAWRRAWEAQHDPEAPRKYLHSWLEQECYDEEVPGRRFVKSTKKARNAAAHKPKPHAHANDNERPTPSRQWQRVQIVESRVSKFPDGGMDLSIQLKADAGDTLSDIIVLDHPDYETQAEGKRCFAALCQACGVDETEDSNDLHGIAFERRLFAGRRQYRAIKAEAA